MYQYLHNEDKKKLDILFIIPILNKILNVNNNISTCYNYKVERFCNNVDLSPIRAQ